MISGLTDRASGVGAPSRMPVPGTIMRAPKSWPIDRLQAAAPPLLSTATRPENAAGIGRHRAARRPGRSSRPAPRRRPSAAARHRPGSRHSSRRPAARPAARRCATLRAAGCRPSATTCSDSMRASAPWKNSPPPRWRIAPSVAGEIGLRPDVAFGHRAAGALAEDAPRLAVGAQQRRAGLQVARQRARHRHAEAGQPLGRRDRLLPAQLAMADVHQRDRRARPIGTRERLTIDRARRRDRREDEGLAGPGLVVMHDAGAGGAQARGRRQGDRQGKIHRDCGVGGIAAALQDVAADLGRPAFVGRHGGERTAARRHADRPTLPGDSRPDWPRWRHLPWPGRSHFCHKHASKSTAASARLRN